MELARACTLKSLVPAMGVEGMVLVNVVVEVGTGIDDGAVDEGVCTAATSAG